MQRHGWPQALPQDPDEHVGTFPPPGRHVHLRVGFPADQHVGLLDHQRRHVGVDVELPYDGHVPDEVPDGG